MFQQLKLKITNVVLALIGEEHLDGEDFNQRIIEYIMREIKKNNKFKDIDFNNKKK